MATSPLGSNPLGVTTTPNQYPQYGINAKGKILKADNKVEKDSLIEKGYLLWFTSRSKAQDSVTSNSDPISSIFGSIGNFWSNPGGAIGKAVGGVANAQNSLYGSVGAAIGAGIDTGFVALAHDLWKVAAGPFFIIAGIMVLLIALWIWLARQGAIASVPV